MDAIDTEILSLLRSGPKSATEIMRAMGGQLTRGRVTSHINSLMRHRLVWIVGYRSCKRPVYSVEEPSAPVEPLPPVRSVVLDILGDGPLTIRQMRERTGRDINPAELERMERKGLIVRVGYVRVEGKGNLSILWRRVG